MKRRTLLACLALMGCGSAPPVVGRYRPYTAQHAPRSTDAAVVVGEGDAKALSEAGGLHVGTMVFESKGGLGSEASIEAEARKLAADRGGTHILQTSGSTELRAEFSVRAGRQLGSYRVVSYAVTAVPSGKWGNLPPGLRPPPLAPAPAPASPPTEAPTAAPSRLPSDGGY
ncbi:MAG TPA: hypothetical protein VFS43_46480 [Polyangiaceae bacterium]|nr:hypothetical protein [Polyangiaceae bacterium]